MATTSSVVACRTGHANAVRGASEGLTIVNVTKIARRETGPRAGRDRCDGGIDRRKIRHALMFERYVIGAVLWHQPAAPAAVGAPERTLRRQLPADFLAKLARAGAAHVPAGAARARLLVGGHRPDRNSRRFGRDRLIVRRGIAELGQFLQARANRIGVSVGSV